MHRDAERSDARSVEQVLAGHTHAFESLVRRHLAAVSGLAYAQIGNRADAEDATQEAFLRAFRSLDTLRDGGKFLPWLAGITRNVCSGFKRSALRHAWRMLCGRYDSLVPVGLPQRGCLLMAPTHGWFSRRLRDHGR